MPDRRRHRSHAPEDPRLFSGEQRARVLEAFGHYVWLLDRGYAERSSLKLVGDRFGLVARQREALRRTACTAGERAERGARRVPAAELAGRRIALDGFNVLTTVESALGGGLVLFARDGCARDLASLGGTWRRVAETAPAIGVIADFLSGAGVGPTRWYLDAPVSNSGKLAGLLRELSVERGLDWEVEVVADPDRALREGSDVVASADRIVIDRSAQWVSLARAVVTAAVPSAWVLDVGTGPGEAVATDG